jgi:hypothetical protein
MQDAQSVTAPVTCAGEMLQPVKPSDNSESVSENVTSDLCSILAPAAAEKCGSHLAVSDSKNPSLSNDSLHLAESDSKKYSPSSDGEPHIRSILDDVSDTPLTSSHESLYDDPSKR